MQSSISFKGFKCGTHHVVNYNGPTLYSHACSTLFSSAALNRISYRTHQARVVDANESNPSSRIDASASRECSFGNKLVQNVLATKWLLERPDCRIDRIVLHEISEDEIGGRKEQNESGQGHEKNGVSAADWKGDQSGGEKSIYDYELQANCTEGDSVSHVRVKQDRQLAAPSFLVLRDDLLHPLMGGNKLRKLDGIIPQLQKNGVSDVVTCGGVQSAHTAAVAVACAETGMSAHLLLRGERPPVLTGYTLMCHMYGHVTYIPRSEYANRDAMFAKHVDRVSRLGGAKTGVIKEGAGDAFALLGLIRLVDYLRTLPEFSGPDPMDIVVDSGTGTTAVGIALGAALLNLPWTVSGVMLACAKDYYHCQQERLLYEFWASHVSTGEQAPNLRLEWIEREKPRKFGKVFEGEIVDCQRIARQTGILLDPIYTLAGWEVAERKAVEFGGEGRRGTAREIRKVVFLHTGGTLGLFGLAQRYPSAI